MRLLSLILLIAAVPLCLWAGEKKPTKKQIIESRIDSVFDQAELNNLHTEGLMRYDFFFSDPDRKRIDLFIQRMKKDSFSLASLKWKDKNWQLRIHKNATHTRQTLYDTEQKLKWIKYNFLIDDYSGFSIRPPDPDPMAIPESEFMPFLKKLSNEHLYWVGEKLLQEQSYDKALNALEMGLKRNFRADTTSYRYGQALVATNEFNDAIEQWKHALKLNPKYIEVHMELGKLYFKNGYFEEALEHFQKADTLQPEDEIILRHVAESLYPLERYNQSYAYAMRARKLDHKDVFVKSLLELLKEPKIRYMRKKFPEK